MDNKWLFDVIKDGTLRDNQSYSVKEGSFKNNLSGDKFCLLERGKNKKFQIYNREWDIWKFLNSISGDINKALDSSNKRSDALVLFNEEEYEHNAGGSLFNISGHNPRNFNLTTGNVVGFVRKGDYSLTINSRFGEGFLKYIIADADGFIELEDIGGEDNLADDYKWLLAYIWNIKLKNAYRLGLPKKYVTKDDRTTRVRGTIDVVDYFQNHKSGKYLCSYREHSYNSPALSLFIEAYKEVKSYPFCRQTRGIYNTFLVANQGVRRSRQEILKTKHFTNQYYSDYNDLIDFSKRIIRNRALNLDSQNDSSAFLFDVSMLFEYFIRKLIARNGIYVESKTKHRWEIPSGAIQGSYKRKLEPDLVFESDGGLYVFDVKYKYFDQTYGVKREDLFQMHTYIGRYGHDATIKGCGFIYPISAERWETLGLDATTGLISDVISQQGRAIPFHVLFLKVPKDSQEGSPGNDFREKMSESCSTFVSTLKGRVMNGSA